MISINVPWFAIISNFSRDVPEIYDIYPGIKGSTHGDKKLINPAKKAIDLVLFIYNSKNLTILQ